MRKLVAIAHCPVVTALLGGVNIAIAATGASPLLYFTGGVLLVIALMDVYGL